MESILLLFSPELSCWDGETVALAGEDPDALRALASSGDLSPLGGGWALTPQGVATRDRLSHELCVPVAPMEAPLTDEEAARDALGLCRMVQHMERAFMTRWGIKEISVSETFPVVPCLSDDAWFAFDGDRVRATWPDAPIVRSFLEAFPHCGYEARELSPPGQEGLDRWADRNDAPRGTLTVDLVLRHRHDFEHYRRHAPLPSDIFRFCDASLIMAHKVRGHVPLGEELLPFIGRVHAFFMGQRRAYAPGRFDMDHEDQETWKLLTLVTDGEAQLRELTMTLRRWGDGLIEPARPMFLIGTSIERMRAQTGPKEMFYDWFQEETVRILRPDAADEEEDI